MEITWNLSLRRRANVQECPSADHELLLAEREHDLLETRSEELDKMASAALVVCALVVAAAATLLVSDGASVLPYLKAALFFAAVAIIFAFVASSVRTGNDEDVPRLHEPRADETDRELRQLLLKGLRVRAGALSKGYRRRRHFLYVAYAGILVAVVNLAASAISV